MCLPLNLHSNLNVQVFWIFFFLRWRRVTLLHCTYINVNIYRPNIWNRRWDFFFFFFCACLKTVWGGGREGGGGGVSTKTRICKKNKLCWAYHESRLNDKKRRNIAHIVHILYCFCVLSIYSLCRAQSARLTQWRLPFSDFYFEMFFFFFHFVCWNLENHACLTWVQRVLYDNVRLCRSKFISLNCIQKGDSKSSCVYGNMFVWINSRKRGLFQVCFRGVFV